MFVIIPALPAILLSQTSFRPRFLDRAVVEHRDASVTVIANYPLPLWQALAAIESEYGWRVNWESAPGVSRYDLADDTDPKWRLTHPNTKGVTRPAGGQFTAVFAEPNETSSVAARNVLQKVVDDYNLTSNPGRYALLAGSENAPTIVGIAIRDDSGHLQPVTPILDSPLTLPKATRSVEDTIALIITTLQVTSGTKIIQATAGTLFSQTPVTLGGRSAPARDLLRQALDATGRPLEYSLFYNADRTEYQLTIALATRDIRDDHGAHRLVPIDHVPNR